MEIVYLILFAPLGSCNPIMFLSSVIFLEIAGTIGSQFKESDFNKVNNTITICFRRQTVISNIFLNQGLIVNTDNWILSNWILNNINQVRFIKLDCRLIYFQINITVFIVRKCSISNPWSPWLHDKYIIASAINCGKRRRKLLGNFWNVLVTAGIARRSSLFLTWTASNPHLNSLSSRSSSSVIIASESSFTNWLEKISTSRIKTFYQHETSLSPPTNLLWFCRSMQAIYIAILHVHGYTNNSTGRVKFSIISDTHNKRFLFWSKHFSLPQFFFY